MRVGLDDFIRDVAARIRGRDGGSDRASRSQAYLQRPGGAKGAESQQSLPQLRSRALVPPNTSLASYTSLVRDVRTVLGKHSGLSAYEAARYSTTAAIEDAGRQHPSLLARGVQEGSAVHDAATAATGPASRRARRGRQEDSAGRDVPVWTTDHEIAFQLFCECVAAVPLPMWALCGPCSVFVTVLCGGGRTRDESVRGRIHDETNLLLAFLATAEAREPAPLCVHY